MIGRIKARAGRIRRGLQFQSVVHQLVLFALIISLIPLFAITYAVVRSSGDIMEDELLKSYGLVHQQYITGVDFKLRLYRESMVKLANNSVIEDALYQIQSGNYSNPYTAGSQISKEVGNFLQVGTYREIRSCMVYSYGDSHQVYGSKVAPAESISRESWYGHYRNRSGNYFFAPGTVTVLSLLQDIDRIDERSLTASKVGFIKLDIDCKQLFDPLTKSGPDEYSYAVVVSDRAGNVLFSSHDGPLPELSRDDSTEELSRYGDYVISRAWLEDYGLEIQLLFDLQQFHSRLNRLTVSLIPYVVTAVGLILLLTFVYSRRFKGRIGILVRKMRRVETGDLIITETVAGRDEIQLLDRSFNEMVGKLEESIRTNYIQALEKKEMEYHNLQLQINPHFLYNTLETVASIAAVHDVYDICDITNRLGDMFRYSLGDKPGSLTTVDQELTHIRNYVFIQKARFGDKLEAVFQVDEELLQRRIMRFVLQPLVENAILHGLAEKRGGGLLELSVTLREDLLVLAVRDNGVGMTPRQVAELSDHIGGDGRRDEERGGIGVRNVNQRIRLIHGDRYGIVIESEPGRGSCFSVLLPAEVD